MNNEMVSVVVPVYNAHDYLDKTLHSILSSSYRNLEVVVMDDGSQDDSVKIAHRHAARDPRVKVHVQSNRGPCCARNHAIALARGEYILPVDADDLISEDFIALAVEAIRRPEVKVVACEAEFIGRRRGRWHLPPFSLPLLARRNLIPASALYRRSDWARVGGYCEEIIAREDWDFWISMLKDGGRVERLPHVGLFYRVRPGSKRTADRKLKRHMIKVLNKRHAEFFERHLGGPLRYWRSSSQLVNKLDRFFFPRKTFIAPEYQELETFVHALPRIFPNEDKVIYKGRNVLKLFERGGKSYVVKRHCVPHLVNRLAYKWIRASKAERSFVYAQKLKGLGIGTPEPVAWTTESNWLLLGYSYLVTKHSQCPFTYRQFKQRDFKRKDEIIRAFARVTAKLHQNGILHKDYSAGNILFDDRGKEIKIEVIDLNRIRFCTVDMELGCRNFERIPGSDHSLEVIADEYGRCRNFPPEECLRIIKANRNEKYYK